MFLGGDMDKVVRLTAEQEAVRNLGVDGRYIVTGPPGTGKSLLAVLRAAKIIAQLSQDCTTSCPNIGNDKYQVTN